MFIGHFAAGFAAKKLDSRPSLGVYFLAAQFIDLLWPVLLLLGIEHVRIDPGNTVVTPLDFQDYPVSHSLLAVIGWAILAAALALYRYRAKRVAWLLGGCVLSHWLLDLVVHRPDLPLVPGFPSRAGWGLWNSLPATIAVELALFALGVGLYTRATRPRDGIGRFGLAGLASLLVLVWAGNFMGPPPPSAEAIAVVGNLQWLFVLLGFWVDRHRAPVSSV